MREILKLSHVNTSFPTGEGEVKAVCDVNLAVREKRVMGLVGETGCGKSVLGQSILKLLPRSAQTSGEILFEEKDLNRMSEEEIRRIRGRRIAYINQNPSEALNPVLKIGTQVIEAIKVCEKSDRKTCRRKAVELLESVSFENPEQVMEQYPCELSGGMRQRVLVAMAMSGNPPFMIADEPTKGLDALIRGQVIDTFKKFLSLTGCGALIITHDLKFARAICDDIALMYAGEIVEVAKTEEFFNAPSHPYLRGLLASMPQNGMHVLKGNSCSLIDMPEGCRFAERCGLCEKKCRTVHPEMKILKEEHFVRCFKKEEGGNAT